MRRLVRWGLAAAGAGTFIYLGTSYFIRPEGVSKEVAGPLRFVPASSGPGVDDLFLGFMSIVGGIVGNKVGTMVVGKG